MKILVNNNEYDGNELHIKNGNIFLDAKDLGIKEGSMMEATTSKETGDIIVTVIKKESIDV